MYKKGQEHKNCVTNIIKFIGTISIVIMENLWSYKISEDEWQSYKNMLYKHIFFKGNIKLRTQIQSRFIYSVKN